jgi:hypothetical protein
MRAEFRGGACDGHCHSVGPVPPESLRPPCRSAVRGHYVRAETRTPEGPNGLRATTDLVVYDWESQGETPLMLRLSSLLGLDNSPAAD